MANTGGVGAVLVILFVLFAIPPALVTAVAAFTSGIRTNARLAALARWKRFLARTSAPGTTRLIAAASGEKL